jgi:hypothetical protein
MAPVRAALRDARAAFSGGTLAKVKTARDGSALPRSLDRARDATKELADLEGLADDAVIMGEGRLKGLAMPAHVHDAIVEFERATAPQAWGFFGKALRGYMQWWRAWTLGGSDFHFRNVVGNMLNNHVAGVSPIDGAYYHAFRAFADGKASFATKVKMNDGTYRTIGEMYEEAKKHGALKTQFSTSFERIRQDVIDSEKLTSRANILPLVGTRPETNALLKLNAYVGDLSEGWTRFAHYIAKRREGMHPAAASMSVKRVLFDTTELTEFERGILRPILPFYGFLKNNLSYHLNNVFAAGSKYGTIEAAKKNLNHPDAPPDEFLNRWMQFGGAVRTSAAKNGIGEVWQFGGMDTLLDLYRFGGGEGDTAAGAVSPIAKAMLFELWPVINDMLSQSRLANRPRVAPPGTEEPMSEYAGFSMRATPTALMSTLTPGIVGKVVRANPFGFGGSAPNVVTDEGERLDGKGTPGWGGAPYRQRRDPSVLARASQFLIGGRPYIMDYSSSATRSILEDKTQAEHNIKQAAMEERKGAVAEANRLRMEALALKARAEQTAKKARAAGIPLGREVVRGQMPEPPKF